MVSRIHNNQVLDIGVFVDLKSVVEFVKVIYFSRVHYELKSNSAVLIRLMQHWHLKAIFIHHYM
jgi:hypothetical protein